jgi:L-2,4-diaminobutyric acid acetyltransferase
MDEDASTRLEPPTERLQIRPPSQQDAAPIWSLVAESPELDDNSPYAYLLLCSHFADTGLVARIGPRLVGFVLGYARPDDASTAFVWQVAVADEARGCGLGGQLLDRWFARCARRSDVRFLEATVTPSNAASRALFCSFARRRGAPVQERVAFPQQVFPESVSHEEEIAIRIGPVPLSRAFALPHQETT